MSFGVGLWAGFQGLERLAQALPREGITAMVRSWREAMMQNTGTKQIFFLVTVLATVSLGLVWPVLRDRGSQAAVELVAQQAADVSICQSVSLDAGSSDGGQAQSSQDRKRGSGLCAPGQRFTACCVGQGRRRP
jgi:hypothetical protein